jgi:uncharacterized protein YjbI with pentapeptide repeats
MVKLIHYGKDDMQPPTELSDYFEQDPRCSYKKDVSEIPTDQREETMSEQVGGIDPDDDGYWHCSHPQLPDHDACVFHTLPEHRPADFDLGEYFVSLVTAEFAGATRDHRRKVKQFIGADFNEVDLNFEHLDTADNLVIDLRCCNADAFHFESAAVTNPVDIRGSTITRFNATESSWHQLYAQHLNAELVEFDQATIQRAYFENTNIETVQFYWTEIDYVNYHECDITWANFMYSRLGEAGFFNSEFHVATFNNADISGGYFNDASFSYLVYKGVNGDSAHFSGVSAEAATFENVELGSLSIKQDSDPAEFNWITLDEAEIGKLHVSESDLGIASFVNAEIELLLLLDFSFHYILDLDETKVRKKAIVRPELNEDIGYVSHYDARIEAGEYIQPQSGDVIYDFTDAVVGDLNLEGSIDGNLLDYIRFYRTEFDGFKFGKLAEVDFDDLNHTIHTIKNEYKPTIQIASGLTDAAEELHPAFGEADPLGASGKYNTVDFEFISERGIEQETRRRAVENVEAQMSSDDPLETDLNALETTYLRAKNGASNVGDSVTAGRFFEKERTYRRKRHWKGMVSGDTPLEQARRGSQWARNWLFAVSAGYGERPLRVIGFSIGLVGIFTVAYVVTGEPLAGVETPSKLAYFLFSFQSFIAFVVGSPSGTDALTIRFLSAFEGFLGAFIVGLFVFVLTRQVHR